MENEQQMTLDDLAALVSRGFSDMAEQFAGLRGEVTDLKAQVNGLRHEVTGLRVELTGFRAEVERRFEGVAGQFSAVGSRFDRVERDLAEVKYLLTDVVRRDEFLDLKQRVEVVERHLGIRS
ncbi:MAG: hypothetical protein HY355_04220 [Armatimonadetes bacterium]|nr:hypothetical protein [Armatimonadota bacterium]